MQSGRANLPLLRFSLPRSAVSRTRISINIVSKKDYCMTLYARSPQIVLHPPRRFHKRPYNHHIFYCYTVRGPSFVNVINQEPYTRFL